MKTVYKNTYFGKKSKYFNKLPIISRFHDTKFKFTLFQIKLCQINLVDTKKICGTSQDGRKRMMHLLANLLV